MSITVFSQNISTQRVHPATQNWPTNGGGVNVFSSPAKGGGAAPQNSGADLTDQQARQKAEEILEVGRRPFIDDYDARVVRFAEEMEKLSPEAQAKLLEEIMAQDHGALAYWMHLDTLDRMQNEGRITQEQYAAVASSFAQAYQEGKISEQGLMRFLVLSEFTGRAPAIFSEGFNQMLEFLEAGGKSPQMLHLRENLSKHLLSLSLEGQGAWNVHAPGLAMQIAAGSGDPSMPARVFNDVVSNNGRADEVTRQDRQEKLLNAIGESSIGFRNSQGGNIPGLVNPMATLIDSVAQQPKTNQWTGLAIDLARYAEAADPQVFFDPYTDKPHPDTARSLSQLLGSHHGDAILTDLAHWDSRGTPGRDAHAQRFGQNAIELGNLLRITAFNPDNPYANVAMDRIQAWTQMRKDFLNGVKRDFDDWDAYPSDMTVSSARKELAMLGGAVFDAVQQVKIDQDNREAATQTLVGFVVDLGLSLVPGGGKISSLVASDLKASFGDRPAINRLIDQALAQGDTLTSAQINQLKQEIAGALSEEQLSLEALRQQASDFVCKSVVNGLSEGTQGDGGQSHRDIVEGNIQNVQDDIQENRR